MCLCRHAYDAFLVVHGTDTMAYTASALSLMLVGKSGRLEPESGSQLTCTLAAQVPVSLDIQQVSMACLSNCRALLFSTVQCPAPITHSDDTVYLRVASCDMCAHVVNMVAACPAAIAMPPSGFKKPIVMTGSQLPLSSPRSDARQNLIDALTCATASFKVSSSSTKSRKADGVCRGLLGPCVGRLMGVGPAVRWFVHGAVARDM